jgi:hypothetical protein
MAQVHLTADGIEVIVFPGKTSPENFAIKYRKSPEKQRTPRLIHFIIDLYIKRTGNLELTNQLIDHIIVNVVGKVLPIPSFPPTLTTFSSATARNFAELDNYGDYSVELLLVVLELMVARRKTVSPGDSKFLDFFRKYRDGADLFTIISAATFR